MRRIEIKPGDTYGDLKIIREAPSSGKRHVLCQCSCGQKVTVRLGHLCSGHTKTCGRCGILYKGKRRTIIEWATLHGLNESTLRARLKIMGMKEALEKK